MFGYVRYMLLHIAYMSILSSLRRFYTIYIYKCYILSYVEMIGWQVLEHCVELVSTHGNAAARLG